LAAQRSVADTCWTLTPVEISSQTLLLPASAASSVRNFHGWQDFLFCVGSEGFARLSISSRLLLVLDGSLSRMFGALTVVNARKNIGS
jgi:hypothetical protein